ncbi:MAG: zf-HC2 domain-containing protein [Actinomycetota bacterium]
MSFYPRHVEREILSALIDGELDPSQRREVYEHLQECAACRETVEEFSNIHGLVGDLPRLIAPEAFVSEALRPRDPSRVQAATSTIFGGRRKWIAAGMAAAGFAITIGGLAAPAPANEPPVDVFIERHVTVHAGVETGGQVLFAVNGR